mmetsp:Transcript_10947/g.15660  ORF Transcript_10947/g.15660 Transcript_10947/m.15660 type:complete len:89 (-) Transcript_10947:152-418(-)
MKGELCLEEKCSTARVRSLSNSSSSSQIVRPLNSHWRERLEDRGSVVGVTTPAVCVVVDKPIEDKCKGGNVDAAVDSMMNSSCCSCSS